MLRRIAILMVAGATAVAAVAAAQGRRAEVSELARRVQAEVACVSAHRRELDQALRLLGEAREQLLSTRSGERALQDAAASVEALEARIAEIGRGLVGCVTAHQANAEEEGPRGTSLDAQAVSGPVSLGRSVRIVRGLQVDGRGRADAGAIGRAVRRLGPPLESCYERLVAVGALARGQLDVVFTVTPSAQVRDASVEGSTIADSAFQQCVSRAARRLSVESPAVGGPALFSFTLGFGPG